MSPTAFPTPRRKKIGFGLIGGGLAWLVHLLLTYGIAEFGCPSRHGDWTFLGITGVAWMLLGASAGTIPIALAATWVSHRRQQVLRREALDKIENEEDIGSELTLARIGFLSSLIFAVTILVQTIPIFFFLQSC